MALSYQETAALMTDATFNSRIAVACMTYAKYIAGETTPMQGRNTAVRWAQATVANASASASAIAPVVVMDPNVQAQGAAIDDPGLQTAVETAINNSF
jgi:hypothetical protein